MMTDVGKNVAKTSNNQRNKITGDLIVPQTVKLFNHSISQIGSQL